MPRDYSRTTLAIKFIGLILFAATSFVAPTLLAADTNKLTPEQLDFFEKKVRPVFIDNCYKCHSQDAEKVKGGLLLDSRAGVLKGGDTGPAIVPGNADMSLMIQAIRYTNKDLQMPPNDRQLANSEINILEQWVKMGAPDPRTESDATHKYIVDIEKAKKHWSFQPIVKPADPEPADPQHWAQTPIDEFILDKMLPKGLTPSPRAEKITLLRRVTFDLIGLPPTPKEMEDFVADTSTNAYEKVVDRLLASPHYGERWGRHWLDIAHYADTRGVNGGNREEHYPYSYIYRDYVIRAFNEDKPYDQFLIEQIAADKLPPAEDKHALAAMGFLTLGNRFNNQQNDIIDDRIDIIFKGTMALTVTCARCHDHKFDPIPTKDYYALHGVFSSSMEPKEEPLIETPKNTPAYQAFCKEYAEDQAALAKFRSDTGRVLKAEMIGKSGAYMLALHDFYSKSNDISRGAYLDKRGLMPQLGSFWDNYLKNAERRPFHPVFTPWFAFARLSNSEFIAKSKELSAEFYANKDMRHQLNPLVARMFGDAPTSLAQVASRYESLFSDVEEHWQSALASYEAKKRSSTSSEPELKGLPNDPAREQIRELMYAQGSPMLLEDNRLNSFIQRDNKMRNKNTELQRAIDELVLTNAGSPARAPVLEDDNHPRDSVVFIKGNPGNRGPSVHRHFLSILSDENPPTFKDGSGRLELAKDIASTNNPLTARVIVNRIWLNHFGEGLVRTPDDFGTRGEPPTHPELLDYLASRFMEEGWSIKKLHRLILLSAVYQQSSEENPRYDQIDPDNRFWWRMNRRRLDFEALRDTILAIGGDLDLSMGGKPVRLDAEPYSSRRTVYGLVDRRNVPSMFQAFDFASPDLTTGKRETTVVPQQALFMMNNALVIEQAKNVVRRVDFKAQAGAEARVNLLYNLIYQRNPTETEMRLALDYIRSDASTEWQTNSQVAWDYGYGQYDASMKRVKFFAPMGTFANRSWQPAGKNLDAALKGLSLTPDGGTPVKGFAVIRRWLSPRDGFITIEGPLVHQAKEGDGVQGTIVSSRSGELGSWSAHNQRVETKLTHFFVKRGEVIDFVTSARDNPHNLTFKWSPRITMEPPANLPKDAIVEWNAQRDFSGEARNRHLTPWEKFAQVLLETNELTFVN